MCLFGGSYRCVFMMHASNMYGVGFLSLVLHVILMGLLVLCSDGIGFKMCHDMGFREGTFMGIEVIVQIFVMY